VHSGATASIQLNLQHVTVTYTGLAVVTLRPHINGDRMLTGADIPGCIQKVSKPVFMRNRWCFALISQALPDCAVSIYIRAFRQHNFRGPDSCLEDLAYQRSQYSMEIDKALRERRDRKSPHTVPRSAAV